MTQQHLATACVAEMVTFTTGCGLPTSPDVLLAGYHTQE